MFTLKLMLALGMILNLTLARPMPGTDDTKFDMKVLNPLQEYINDSAKEPLLVRTRRQNFLAVLSTYLFVPLGVRGEWRFCRYTRDGASVYTNGIDVVCRGLCADDEVTCNDYYRPYFYNYFA